MSIIRRPSDVLAALIAESEELETAMESWQRDAEETQRSDIDRVRASYRDWMSRAKQQLVDEQLEKFVQCYEGTLWTPGVKPFLTDPLKESPMKDDEGNFILGMRWLNDFGGIREQLEHQRALLSDAMRHVGSIDQTLEDLAGIFRRLGDYVRTLPTDVSNERDLQDVVDALLTALFADVRREDPSPQVAGASSRLDFHLPEVGVVIELKMTRQGLADKKVGEELLVDAGRYPKHPDCRAILNVIYDPDRRVNRRNSLERDLSVPTREGIPVITIVAV